MPIHHAIGNHDIWGRFKTKCHATGNEPFFGKRWFLDNFEYPRTYYSFDQAGWHFIVLDSFDLDADGPEYTSRIVGPQLDWLIADLAATKPTMPIVVITHVPIISVSNFFDHGDKVETEPDITVERHPHARGPPDARQAVHEVPQCEALPFRPSAPARQSGIQRRHLHLRRHVCGDKWKGPRVHTPEGYGLIDLYADGTFSHQYVAYGWKAEKA